jgi:hypothetical protein
VVLSVPWVSDRPVVGGPISAGLIFPTMVFKPSVTFSSALIAVAA